MQTEQMERYMYNIYIYLLKARGPGVFTIFLLIKKKHIIVHTILRMCYSATSSAASLAQEASRPPDSALFAASPSEAAAATSLTAAAAVATAVAGAASHRGGGRLLNHPSQPLVVQPRFFVWLGLGTSWSLVWFCGSRRQPFGLSHDIVHDPVVTLVQGVDWVPPPQCSPVLVLGWNAEAGIHYCESPEVVDKQKVLEELWIPIYNYSYRKFIYVSILKPRR